MEPFNEKTGGKSGETAALMLMTFSTRIYHFIITHRGAGFFFHHVAIVLPETRDSTNFWPKRILHELVFRGKSKPRAAHTSHHLGYDARRTGWPAGQGESVVVVLLLRIPERILLAARQVSSPFRRDFSKDLVTGFFLFVKR